MTGTPDSGSESPTSPTVRSMTGFGRAERHGDGITVQVEARSVNAKHLKVSWRLPSELDGMGAALEPLVRERATRGTVTLSVNLVRTTQAAPSRIDAVVLADYARQAREAADVAGLPSDVRMEDLLRLPGVLVEGGQTTLADAEVAIVRDGVAAALDQLAGMRGTEGASMHAVLSATLDEMDGHAARIAERVPVALAEHKDRLEKRLTAILEGSSGVAEDLLAREVAVLADRSDVAEEIDRLRSHDAQARDALASGEPCGRRLEFLSQEMTREANTIGSKSNDTDIRAAVVDLKLAVERLKEQAANVE